MKTSSVKESFAYSGLKILESIVTVLPYPAALALGRWLGRFYCALSPRKRGTVYRNLKIAFADSKFPSEIRRITRRTFEVFGEKLTEMMKLSRLSEEQRARIISVDGQENIDEAMSQGKGMIFLSMHFGSWEAGNFLFPTFGYPYKALVNDPGRYPKLDALLNDYRRSIGGDFLSPDSGIREFLKALKNGAMMVMLSDQGGREGIHVPFFGRSASMPIGAVKIGMKHQVPVCFVAVVPEAGQRALFYSGGIAV